MSESHCGCGWSRGPRPRWFCFCSWPFLLLARSRAAQGTDDLEQLNHEIERLFSENKTAEAVPLAERYVELARQRYGEDNPEYRNGADLARFALRIAAALCRGRAALEKRAGDSREGVWPGSSAGCHQPEQPRHLYQREGRAAEAEELREARESHPREGARLGRVRGPSRQIQELRWGGKEQEAVQLAEHYVELAKERYGEDQPDFAPPLLLLAQLYASQARPADAEALFKQAVAIRETALGPEICWWPTPSCNSPISIRRKARYQEAEALFKRALSIREKHLDRIAQSSSTASKLLPAFTRRPAARLRRISFGSGSTRSSRSRPSRIS